MNLYMISFMTEGLGDIECAVIDAEDPTAFIKAKQYISRIVKEFLDMHSYSLFESQTEIWELAMKQTEKYIAEYQSILQAYCDVNKANTFTELLNVSWKDYLTSAEALRKNYFHLSHLELL